MKNYTFRVNGKDRTFSEAEIIEALERQFFSETQGTVPEIGKWFLVNPNAIDRNLFLEKRNEPYQEKTRKLILEAFAEADTNPDKYLRPFCTMIPQKVWERKTIKELKDIADSIGDHLASWIEKAFEWAQRLANGESWEDVCNKPYAGGWYHLITWKIGNFHLFGGARENYRNNFAEDVNSWYYLSGDVLENTVPSIVLYK